MNGDRGQITPADAMGLLDRLTSGMAGRVILVLIGIFFALVVLFTGSIPIAILPFAVLAVLALFFVKPSWGIITVVLLQTIKRFFAMLVGALPLFTVNRALVLWLLLSVLLHRFALRTRKSFYAHPQNRVALLYCLWYTVCALLAASKVHAAHVFPQMMGNFLFFFLVYQLIETEKQLRFVFLSFITLLCGSGFISWIGWKLTGSSLFGIGGLAGAAGDTMVRMAGMAGMEPNNYAVVVVICLLSLAVMLWWKDLARWHRISIMTLMFGFLFMLSKTLSRTGMLMFLLAGALYVIRYRKRIGMKRILVGVAIVTVLLGALLSENVIDRFTSISKVQGGQLSEDRSISNRIGLTLMLPTLMARNPIFGVGPGNIPYLTAQAEFRRFVARNLEAQGYRSHNQYVQLIGETGLIGFIIFATLMGLCVRDLLVSRRLVAPYPRTFLWCLVESLLLTLPLYFLGAATLEAANKKSFWFLVALPIITRRLLEARYGAEGAEDRAPAGAEEG